MVAPDTLLAARGLTDREDRLLSADQPLAELQLRCGGRVPGILAIPELLDLVRQGRQTGLRIAREFAALDGDARITGFARVQPQQEGDGCELLIESWRREPLMPEDDREAGLRQDAIDRATAEFSARLDGRQRLLAGEGSAPDLSELIAETRRSAGKPWTDYVELIGINHRQPLHWRLLDGARVRVEGSQRDWRARLIPVGMDQIVPRGFELLLVAEQAPFDAFGENEASDAAGENLVGEALKPALREPVARIIANAEKIRSRLAGPLRAEYSNYAEDISAAGKHLSALLNDLGDLETVESPGFSPARQKIDLAETARQCVSMLATKAQARRIELRGPSDDAKMPAIGEGKRVLQVLLNLVGNAINYSPEGTAVEITVAPWRKGRPSVTVQDHGPGLSAEQREKIFTKFERLGRSGDGGSGLGLYISRRLAEAMGGEISVESEPGKGARFTLVLPGQD